MVDMIAGLVCLYFLGMGATHLAMKHMHLEVPTWKRALALALWPSFVFLLMMCDMAADALRDALDLPGN